MAIIDLYASEFDGVYDSVEKIFLCEFIPGHGGDFFVTLYSLCNNDFIKCIEENKNIEDRLVNFPNMPGNNLGGKYLFKDSYIMIEKDLIKFSKFNINRGNKKYINLVTHPTIITEIKNNQVVPNYGNYPADDIFDLFDLEYEVIILLPTTFESFCFSMCYYESRGMDITNITRNLIESLTQFNTGGESLTQHKNFNHFVTYIDHIDILLNCPEKFLPLCKKISSKNIDETMFNYTLNFYIDNKVTDYRNWFKNLSSEKMKFLKDIYQEYKTEYKFTIVNSKNIDEFLK